MVGKKLLDQISGLQKGGRQEQGKGRDAGKGGHDGLGPYAKTTTITDLEPKKGSTKVSKPLK